MKRNNTHTKNAKETQILGYNVPFNYFEKLETSILDKIELNNVEEEHHQKLGFKVPENYFETSKNEILTSIKPKEKAVISFTSFKKWYLVPVAASIAFILLLNFYNLTNEKSTIVVAKTEVNKDSFNLNNDAMINSLMLEDENVDGYIENYVLNKLVIDDVISYFVDLNDATLSTLLVEDIEVDGYLTEFVLDDLLINSINTN